MKKFTNLMSAGWHSTRPFAVGLRKDLGVALGFRHGGEFPHYFALILLVLINTGLPVSAQEASFSQSSPVPKFALSASMQDTLKGGDSARLQNPPIISSIDPLPSIIPQNFAGMTQKKVAPAPVLSTQNPKVDNDRPNSYLEEYNVNWSPWMGQLAYDWHEILKGCEEVLGVQFHTARPALIQFTCYADGRIGNVVLRQSSGIPVYDRLQIAALMQVRLLPFPNGTVRSRVTLIQGWESHTRHPGEEEFQPGNFASRYPQERVSKWVTPQ